MAAKESIHIIEDENVIYVAFENPTEDTKSMIKKAFSSAQEHLLTGFFPPVESTVDLPKENIPEKKAAPAEQTPSAEPEVKKPKPLDTSVFK